MTATRLLCTAAAVLALTSCGAAGDPQPTQTVTVTAAPSPTAAAKADIWDDVEPVVANDPEVPDAPQGDVTDQFRASVLGELYTPWTAKVTRVGDRYTAYVRPFTDVPKADEICYAMRETFTDGTQKVEVRDRDTLVLHSATGGQDNLCPQQQRRAG